MPDSLKTETFAWHALDSSLVFDKIDSSEHGLTSQSANERLARYGVNRIKPPKRQSILVRLLKQFQNVLIYVLLLAGVITLLLGHWIDSSVIFGVVIINAIIGFIQEGKAERALDAIR
ncbi:MAG: cation-transporting P-type ATPase, partial [Gammaproteobacteria bacterium]